MCLHHSDKGLYCRRPFVVVLINSIRRHASVREMESGCLRETRDHVRGSYSRTQDAPSPASENESRYPCRSSFSSLIAGRAVVNNNALLPQQMQADQIVKSDQAIAGFTSEMRQDVA